MIRILATLVIIVAALFCIRYVGAEPDLTLSSDLVEITGEMAEVELRNEGGKTLLINRLMTNCSCAKVSIGETLIAPGESTLLRIELNAERSVEIMVSSNDREEPVKFITAFRPSQREFDAPQVIDLGVIGPDSLPLERKFVIYVADIEGKFEFQTSDPALKLSLAAKSANSDSYVNSHTINLTMTALPQEESGPLEIYCTIGEQTITIPVLATFQSD